jgi:PAS domain-containing protein
MLLRENLITSLDTFNTAVYLKDLGGRHLSMNSAGINFMGGNHGSVLGKTCHDLFDLTSANKMVESDQFVMQNGRIHMTAFDALDKLTGQSIPMFNAKTSVFSPTGKPLGVIGISIVGHSEDEVLFSEVCEILPKFVQRKQPHLLNELLELQTVTDFFKLYQLH